MPCAGDILAPAIDVPKVIGGAPAGFGIACPTLDREKLRTMEAMWYPTVPACQDHTTSVQRRVV